jgi:hypothetical protein
MDALDRVIVERDEARAAAQLARGEWATVRRQLDELRGRLRELERAGVYSWQYEVSGCPACHADADDPEVHHAADCWLAEAIGTPHRLEDEALQRRADMARDEWLAEQKDQP